MAEHAENTIDGNFTKKGDMPMFRTFSGRSNMTKQEVMLTCISEYHIKVLLFATVVIMCLYNIFKTLLLVFRVKMPTLDTVYMKIKLNFCVVCVTHRAQKVVMQINLYTRV